jgi:hypothetical protein
MPFGAEHVPEDGGKLVGLIRQAHRLRPLHQRFLGLARGADAGQIAFDVGGEDRHAGE